MNYRLTLLKKNKIWVWTVVNKAIAGMLAIVIGNRSAETFKPLWQIVKRWQCFFYVRDGYVVYPQFIEDADQIVNKTYMTPVEGENTRLRHYLARIQLKNFMLLQISRNVKPIGEVGCLLSQT